MKSLRAIMIRTGMSLVISFLGIVILSNSLTEALLQYTSYKQRNNSQVQLENARAIIATNAANAREEWEILDKFSMAKMNTLAYVMENANGTLDLETYAQQWRLEALYLCSDSAKVLDSYIAEADKQYYVRFDQLLTGTPYYHDEERSYYAAPLGNRRVLVGVRDTASMYTSQDSRITLEHALADLTLGTNSYIAAMDTEGKIRYDRDPNVIGQDAATQGMLVSSEDGVLYEVDSENFTGYVNYLHCDNGIILVAKISTEDFLYSMQTFLTLAKVIFMISVLLMVLYSQFIRSDIAAGRASQNVRRLIGSIGYDVSVSQKLISVLAIGVALIFCTSLYMQSLTAQSYQRIESEKAIDHVQNTIEINEERAEQLETFCQKEYIRITDNIAWAIYKHPELLSYAHLNALKERAGAYNLYVFDGEGRSTALNSDDNDYILSNAPDSNGAPFWDIIHGHASEIVLDPAPDDIFGTMVQYIGVQRTDSLGFVRLGVLPDMVQQLLENHSSDNVLKTLKLGNNGFVFTVDATSNCFLTYPDKQYLGLSALDSGIHERALKSDYIGIQRINGQYYFMCTQQQGNQLLCVVEPQESTTLRNLASSAYVSFISFCVLFAILLCFSIAHAKYLPRQQTSGDPAADHHEHRRKMHVAENRSGSHLKWNTMLASQKMGRVIRIAVGIAAVLSAAYIAVTTQAYDPSSILSFILSARWEWTVNIFSVSFVLILFLEVTVFSILLRNLIAFICRSLGPRWETLGHLFNSFIAYCAVLGALYVGLQYFGVESSTLLGSAGVLTLIVGLGSQEIVADVIAGIFFVFEADFRVGDVVAIRENRFPWVGVVVEIGMRTTQIQDRWGNVKMYRNSQLTSIINMSRQHSYANIVLCMAQIKPLEEMESIIKTELLQMRDKLPGLLEGPNFEGILALGSDTITVRITACCEEVDRENLENALRRELKLAFEGHEIHVETQTEKWSRG